MRLICLANSFKHSGRCLAGIDAESGEWVRPVPPAGGPVAVETVTVAGIELKPLDVVEVEVGPPAGLTRYQSENRPLLSPVRMVGRLPAVELRRYAEIEDRLLHSLDDRVDPEYLDGLPPERWKSLALIRPRQLSFTRDQFKPHRFRVNFLDPFWNPYSLKLTDPAAIALLNRGERLSSHSFLVVSLTEPYRAAGSDLPPLCYKLVAGVIDF